MNLLLLARSDSTTFPYKVYMYTTNDLCDTKSKWKFHHQDIIEYSKLYFLLISCRNVENINFDFFLEII